MTTLRSSVRLLVAAVGVRCVLCAAEPNCPVGWQLYGEESSRFCCQGEVDGEGAEATCSAASCAVDGNWNHQGRHYCSEVLTSK